MTIRLNSIDQAPVSLPIWHTILDDLGCPHPARVAKVLGIGQRTVYRYNQSGRAPRCACLALFWLTRWGRSAVHTQAVNDAALAVRYVEALKRQVAQLEHEKSQLLALGDFGAANAPVLTAPADAPAGPLPGVWGIPP